MNLAYDRMKKCNINSGMYVLYRDEYESAKKECDEIDACLKNYDLTGYEEYVLRLRFQEAMKMDKIAGKLKLDAGDEKTALSIRRILKKALGKLGITSMGAVSNSYYHHRKPLSKKQEYDEVVYMEDDFGAEMRRREEIEAHIEDEDDYQCHDCPRDIYGNPLEPIDDYAKEREALLYDLGLDT